MNYYKDCDGDIWCRKEDETLYLYRTSENSDKCFRKWGQKPTNFLDIVTDYKLVSLTEEELFMELL